MSLPTALARVTITQRLNIRQTRSPFTGRSQRQRGANEWWEADLTLPPLRDHEAAAWRSFLLALGGRAGTFRFGPLRTNRGRGGEGVVDGAGQRGRRLLTRGWGVLHTGVLLPGDHFELQGRLYMVTAPVEASISGRAEIPIWPRLRTVPPDGAVLTLDAPTGLWRLDSDELTFAIRPGRYTDIRLRAVEAL